MTPYIQQQLKKLCDNPNWYDDMLTSWDKNPRNQREAIYNYPIGWEWLDKVPLEDFTWLIEIFSIMTDNTDTYDFVGYTDSETLPGQQKVCSVDKIPLANFLNDDQGYKSGISMYGHYIACKCLDISSEREYMNQYTDIRILTNELEPC